MISMTAVHTDEVRTVLNGIEKAMPKVADFGKLLTAEVPHIIDPEVTPHRPAGRRRPVCTP